MLSPKEKNKIKLNFLNMRKKIKQNNQNKTENFERNTVHIYKLIYIILKVIINLLRLNNHVINAFKTRLDKILKLT